MWVASPPPPPHSPFPPPPPPYSPEGDVQDRFALCPERTGGGHPEPWVGWNRWAPKRAPPKMVQASEPTTLTFYAYRAQSDANYHLENVNLANLPGVLLYFHHEIYMAFEGDDFTNRHHKFGISRFLRFKITMKSTREAFDACLDPRYAAEDRYHGLCDTENAAWRDGRVGHQFMRYTAFDSGVRAWEPPGWPSVGCAKSEISRFYDHAYGDDVMYFSLPGPCATKPYAEKSDACRAADPGGECAHPDGGAHCTWHAEPLGHVTLDELMETEGIVDHRGSTGLNQREYKSCFWDERHDAQRNRERVKALDRKFREKYPQIPGDIPAPLCGW